MLDCKQAYQKVMSNQRITCGLTCSYHVYTTHTHAHTHTYIYIYISYGDAVTESFTGEAAAESFNGDAEA